jgi:hypothetical protein
LTRPKRIRRSAPLVALVTMLILAAGVGSAGAGSAIKTGAYTGKTTQESVTPSFRQLKFTVKKGKVTLSVEPTVAHGDCLSTPVFTLDGTSSKKLARDRSFTLTHTFFGNKIDKIHGKFVSPNEVEGYAIYHFQSQDLCSGGKSKVNFTAKHK